MKKSKARSCVRLSRVVGWLIWYRKSKQSAASPATGRGHRRRPDEKVNAAIGRQRMQDCGVQEFEWNISGPFRRHRRLRRLPQKDVPLRRSADRRRKDQPLWHQVKNRAATVSGCRSSASIPKIKEPRHDDGRKIRPPRKTPTAILDSPVKAGGFRTWARSCPVRTIR